MSNIQYIKFWKILKTIVSYDLSTYLQLTKLDKMVRCQYKVKNL